MELHMKDKYWTVELALPFTNLVDHSPTASAPPKNKDQWRINFSRFEFLYPVSRKKAKKSKAVNSTLT